MAVSKARAPFKTWSLLMLLSGAALAGSLGRGVGQPPYGQGDPPGRVGRLTGIRGAVSFEPAGDTEWTVAENNRPITTGDRLWSDADGRGEIDLGSATVRIWTGTELDVILLDDRMLQLRLPQGSASLSVSSLPEGDDIEIDAPNASISLGAAGVYRIEVSPDGATTSVSVWSGSAQVTSAGSSFALSAHQMATVRGDDQPVYDVGPTGRGDEFDDWCQTRDDREDRATSRERYLAGDMPGTADLDDYGDWSNDADYGPVWYPRQVAADWAPYRDGHWAWVGRWGWTWIDDAPWGYAPSHYGRWTHRNDRWGWSPGRVRAPAVFAPGLVAFIGGGANWGRVSFGTRSGVAWFPLAPEEPYRPAYQASDAYVRRVNVTNVTNITNITNLTNVSYRNREIAGAVTAVPRTAFENAAPVARAAVRISVDELRQATVVSTAPAIVPARASLVAEGARRNTARPPDQVERRVVVATHAPPPAPVPFVAQAAAIAARGGRPLSPQELAAIRTSAPVQVATVRALPVRSAAERPAPGRELKPARAGLPEAKPAVVGGVQARPAVPPPAVVTPPPPRQVPPPVVTPPAARDTSPPVKAPPPVVVPRPPRDTSPPVKSPPPVVPPRPTRDSTPPAREPVTPPPAARPEAPDRRPPAARPPVSLAPKSLDTAYAAQRAKMEAKHVGEFAKPPAGVPTKVLQAKQDSEHAALEARYNKAAVEGRTTLPPPEKAGPPQQARPTPPPVVTQPVPAPPPAEPGKAKAKGPPARDSAARDSSAKGRPAKKPSRPPPDA